MLFRACDCDKCQVEDWEPFLDAQGRDIAEGDFVMVMEDTADAFPGEIGQIIDRNRDGSITVLINRCFDGEWQSEHVDLMGHDVEICDVKAKV